MNHSHYPLIKVTHLGEDYATIKVDTIEYQVPLELGLHLLKFADSKSTIHLCKKN